MAYYCLHKLRILPSDYMNLERREKAFVVAAIQARLEAEKKEMSKKPKKGKRR